MSGNNHNVPSGKSVYSQDLESLGIEYLDEALKKFPTLKLEDTKSMVLLDTRELISVTGPYTAEVNRSGNLLIGEAGELLCTEKWDLHLLCSGANPVRLPITDIIDNGNVVVIIFGEPSISYSALFSFVDVCGLTYAEVSKGMLHSWT